MKGALLTSVHLDDEGVGAVYWSQSERRYHFRFHEAKSKAARKIVEAVLSGPCDIRLAPGKTLIWPAPALAQTKVKPNRNWLVEGIA